MGRRKGEQALPIDKVKLIISLTKEGWYRPDIARKLNISKTSVYNYQKKYFN
jgi:transposase